MFSPHINFGFNIYILIFKTIHLIRFQSTLWMVLTQTRPDIRSAWAFTDHMSSRTNCFFVTICKKAQILAAFERVSNFVHTNYTEMHTFIFARLFFLSDNILSVCSIYLFPLYLTNWVHPFSVGRNDRTNIS